MQWDLYTRGRPEGFNGEKEVNISRVEEGWSSSTI